MSGSESSVHGTGAPEPLQLTVHGVDEPRLDADARRTRSGRAKMLLVLLVCAAPVIASYLTYFVIKPSARTNYGTLISPPRPMPALVLRTLDGAVEPSGALKGQWLLVVVAPAACVAPCERLLYAQRQLREMLGRERDRVDKVWLVVDDAMPRAELQQAVDAAPAVTVLRMAADDAARWLAPEQGHALGEHLYLVDPRGDWMMRFPADLDPAKVKRDLDRLLRAAASWDRAGR